MGKGRPPEKYIQYLVIIPTGQQICIVEKDKYGSSHISTIAEFKGVRNDSSIDKDYLEGRFGGLPFLNRLTQIFEPN